VVATPSINGPDCLIVRLLSHRFTARGKPRKRNPSPGEPVVVRLQPHELDLLDAWMVEQDDIPGNRQAAIRRLIALV